MQTHDDEGALFPIPLFIVFAHLQLLESGNIIQLRSQLNELRFYGVYHCVHRFIICYVTRSEEEERRPFLLRLLLCTLLERMIVLLVVVVSISSSPAPARRGVAARQMAQKQKCVFGESEFISPAILLTF